MFPTLFAGALLSLGAHSEGCAKAVPRGPAVPAPIVLSTSCGWFKLETDGTVGRLPRGWYATHHEPWHPPYGLTYRRTRPGRYLAVRDGRVIWRSRGLFFNEAGMGTFGPHAFAFDSWGRRGVFLTDLRGPERLVVHGRDKYPIGFAGGTLLVSGRGTIIAVAENGTVLRRLRFRRSSSFAFDEATGTVYFVSPDGMLTAAHGSAVRSIAKTTERGRISLFGKRLVTFQRGGHLTILRRDDGSLVASASWPGARREIDGGVAVSEDGKLFAFRVARNRGRWASVYFLRAGAGRAHMVYRHPFRQAGCGYSTTLELKGSSLLYRSDDGRGISEVVVLRPDQPRVWLTPLLRTLSRKSASAPGKAFWATDFLE